MIVHKTFGLIGLVNKAIPRWAKEFIGLLILWSGTVALWFFPLAHLVIDAGPKGDSNGAASVMEVFGTIVGLVTVGLTVLWLYIIEDDREEDRKDRERTALLGRIDAIRELRDKEEIMGIEPFPLDDPLEKYVNERHVEENVIYWGAYRNGERIHSKNYATLKSELGAD